MWFRCSLHNTLSPFWDSQMLCSCLTCPGTQTTPTHLFLSVPPFSSWHIWTLILECPQWPLGCALLCAHTLLRADISPDQIENWAKWPVFKPPRQASHIQPGSPYWIHHLAFRSRAAGSLSLPEATGPLHTTRVVYWMNPRHYGGDRDCWVLCAQASSWTGVCKAEKTQQKMPVTLFIEGVLSVYHFKVFLVTFLV